MSSKFKELSDIISSNEYLLTKFVNEEKCHIDEDLLLTFVRIKHKLIIMAKISKALNLLFEGDIDTNTFKNHIKNII